jgi:hypothetical protein
MSLYEVSVNPSDSRFNTLILRFMSWPNLSDELIECAYTEGEASGVAV